MSSLRELSPEEKREILSLIAADDYTLDLSEDGFNIITARTVARALCSEYGIPVSAALRRYVGETGHSTGTLNLLAFLIEYFGKLYARRISEGGEFARHYERCVSIVNAAKGTGPELSPIADCLHAQSVAHILRVLDMAKEDAKRGEEVQAFASARAALESAMKYGLAKSGAPAEGIPDFTDLWGAFKKQFRFPYGADISRQQSDLITGFGKILTAINEVRKSYSVAHGSAEGTNPVDETHIRLFVNAAIALCDYILSVVEEGRVKCL